MRSNPESRIPNPGPLPEIAPLTDTSPARTTVAAAIAPAGAAQFTRSAPISGRLVGTLVHRLLQRAGFCQTTTDAIRDLAEHLVRPDEIDDSEDLDEVIDSAVTAYSAICARDEVRLAYLAGRAFHELPFTMTNAAGAVVRGTIDCVVEAPPGCLTLLEFKTGRERPEDRAQVELYRQALRQLFPGAQIEAQLVYAG